MIDCVSWPRLASRAWPSVYAILIWEKVRSDCECNGDRPSLSQCALYLFLIATLYSVIPAGSQDLYSVHSIVKDALSPSFNEVDEWVSWLSGQSTCFQKVVVDVSWGQRWKEIRRHAVQSLLSTESLYILETIHVELFNSWYRSMYSPSPLEPLISDRGLNPYRPVVPTALPHRNRRLEHISNIGTHVPRASLK